MQPSRDQARVVKFGPFEADFGEGVLRKHGLRIKLQAQPFQVLAALLETPGTAVTREDLRRRLWADDTFVDFEHGLNVAVTRLRQALGDSAEQPKYIETLAKRGYRFIAVEESQTAELRETPSSMAIPVKRRPVIWIAATVVLVAGAGSAIYLVSSRPEPSPGRPTLLTTYPGFEATPALSPDGNQVAFTWNGEKKDNFDIYVMAIPSGRPLRLTSDPAVEISPAWSPDGGTIAFLRRLEGQSAELWLLPAAGGAEHKIADIRNLEFLREVPGRLISLSWSPDGAWIAAAHQEPGSASASIFLFSRTGDKRQLTETPSTYQGDQMPAFSPDGRALAFCRLHGISTSEIYLLPLRPDWTAAGQARALTVDNRWSVNPVWTRADNAILYVFGGTPSGQHEIRIIKSSDGQTSSRPIPFSDDAREISLGRHLVYSRQTREENIWRARIPAAGEPPSKPELFISSTQLDAHARYSPDGTRVAFASWRSGSGEIWISKADGTDSVRKTFFGGTMPGPFVGALNWSPDGQWIVFHARPEGQADIFVIPSAGGQPKRLTTDKSDDALPSYSRDGRWIYFTSSRSGEPHIWKIPAAGGEAVMIPGAAGWMALESADGGTLYFYESPVKNEIWKVPTVGGSPLRVIGPTDPMPAFAVTSRGIYYTPPWGTQCFIRFFDFFTAQSRSIVVTDHPIGLGMSVSPDSKFIIFVQQDEFRSDLVLVENFQAR